MKRLKQNIEFEYRKILIDRLLREKNRFNSRYLSRYTIHSFCFCSFFSRSTTKALTACIKPIAKLRNKILFNIVLFDIFCFFFWSIFLWEKKFQFQFPLNENRFRQKCFNSIRVFYSSWNVNESIQMLLLLNNNHDVSYWMRLIPIRATFILVWNGSFWIETFVSFKFTIDTYKDDHCEWVELNM